MEQKMKEIAKSLGSILVIGLVVSLTVHFIDALGSHGIILGVVAGAFGYQPLRDQIAKLKALQ
jgi:hypothetical protein